jgi:hypothetical protein
MPTQTFNVEIRIKEEGLQTAAIKEYLSGVRTVCRLYGNNRNATERGVFGIESRVFVDNRDKSLPQEVYSRVVTELKKTAKVMTI